MIDFIHKDAYWQDSIDKQLKIELEDGTIIDNSMIYSEEFELEENLCSDDTLRFGSCEASCVKFRIFAIPNNLVGQKINISEVVGGQTDNPMQIGKYKIASATPTADRDCIDIVAYDSMYDIIHSDVAEWYNNQFKATTTTETDTDGNTITTTTYSATTLKKFRDSFFSHFGIEQVSTDLPNDNMIVSKTIEIVPDSDGAIGETLSGSSVIEAICEINGCFGHINRDGKFEYVFLQPIAKELFPSDDLFPSNDLFPASDNVGVVIYNWQYEPVEYEDYGVQPITQVQITQEENDIGITVGEDGNKYIVDSNFLTYSLSDEELKTVGTNILSEVRKVKYTPIKANVIGNPCVMLGDIIKIVTNTKILYSYVLNRSLSGCQSLTDDIEVKGEEYRSVDVNSTNAQIKKLQGRSNVLERSIDETRSTITNVERGLKSEIKQTADSITQEIEDRKSEDSELSSKIEQTATSITQTVASSSDTWDTVDSSGNNVTIALSGYGFDGYLSGGTAYVFSDTIQKGDIYLDQETGYGWSCGEPRVVDGRRVGTFGYRPRYVFVKKNTKLNSKIEQTAESITSTVSATQSKWDVSPYIDNGYTITYGYSEPEGDAPQADKNAYLNVTTGFLYETGYVSDISKYVWQGRGYRKEIKDVLQSSIEQTAESINLSVDTKLEGYSTTEEMNSAINVSKDSIESAVTQSGAEWDFTDSEGEKITPDYYSPIGGSTIRHFSSKEEYYAYVDIAEMTVGQTYFESKTGWLWECYRKTENAFTKNAAVVNQKIQLKKKTAELSTSIKQTQESIALEVTRATEVEGELASSIEQTASEIVLKVDANGKIVEVALSADPKEGTTFTLDADNIDLTANDIFNIIAGNELNLTAKNISIDSTNFSVDEDGNMSCKNATVEGDVIATSAVIYDSLSMKHTVYSDVDIEKVLEVRYRTDSDPAEWCVYANIREFTGDVSVEGSLSARNGLGVSGNAVFNNDIICQSITANANANILGTFTAGAVSSAGATINGTLSANGDTLVPNWYNNTTQASANTHIGAEGRIKRVASSSKRYKKDITTELKEELDPNRLYDTTIYQYKYKDGYISEEEKNSNKDCIGFIVEDLIRQYPVAIDYIKDADGNDIPENWNERYLIPPMLKLIQDQKKEIDELKSTLQKLTERMDKYEQSI